MYVCTYVRMYVCTYVRMYVCTYVRMYVCTYVRMYVCTYVRMYVCTYVRTYLRVMYVTTTTNKYNYLKNVKIGFLIFLIQTKSCPCIRAANRNRYEITTGYSSLCKYYYVTTRHESPALISYRKS